MRYLKIIITLLFIFSINTVEALPVDFNRTGLILMMHNNNDSYFGENNTVVYDFSGTGNNGTNTNAIPISDGKIDGAINFATNTSLFLLDVLNYISIEAHNFCAWAKINYSQGRDPCIIIGWLEGGFFGGILYGSSIHRTYYQQWDAQHFSTVSVHGNIDGGDWHYYCGGLNDTHAFYYEDSVKIGVAYIYTTLEFYNKTYVGGDLINSCDVIMDEVTIWNRSLSTDEISELYNEKSCLTTIPLVNCFYNRKIYGSNLNLGSVNYTGITIHYNNIIIKRSS